MTKRNFAVAALVVAAILIAGGLYASNMGFKLNYVLQGKGVASSSTGYNTIALPYFSPLADAKTLIDDLQLADGNADVDFNQVARFDKPSDSLVGYNGLISQNFFTLTPGQGYWAQMNPANNGITLNYIIVGSHDPGLVLSLTDEDPALSNGTGYNSFSYPYHSTSANAKALIDEINAVVPGAVVQVTRFDATSDSLIGYNGLIGTAFALVPGQTYALQVDEDVPAWVPSHY